jgi:heptaprenyl diphosphate synthase
MDPVRRLSRVALLVALATVIHTAEAMIPVTALWFRFGFANIIALSAIYLYGFKDALTITIGRIIIGSLFSGTFGAPAFMLSFAGGLLSICVMGLAFKLGRRVFSEIGVSILGAVSHNFGQIMVAYLVIVRTEAILALFPLLMIMSLITGTINGLAARFLIKRLEASARHLKI